MNATLNSRSPARPVAAAGGLLARFKAWVRGVTGQASQPNQAEIRQKLKAVIWAECAKFTPITALEMHPDFKVPMFLVHISVALRNACAAMGASIDLLTLIDLVRREAERNGLGDSLAQRCTELVVERKRAGAAG